MNLCFRLNGFLLALILLTNCQESNPPPKPLASQNDSLQQILFLGHCYRFRHLGANRIDQRLELLDKSRYDQFWFGGDLCIRSSEERSTLMYLDSMFDFSNPRTHWSLGNHDVNWGNVEWISEFTQRPLHYSSHQDGLTMMVWNTSIDSIWQDDPERVCQEKAAQYALFRSIVDTIQASSHLVMLFHHVPWWDTYQKAKLYANGTRKDWHMTCDSVWRFREAVFPYLQAVEARGVEVVCIAGDVGMADFLGGRKYGDNNVGGVDFLGSGIGNSRFLPYPKRLALAKRDYVLVLEHHLRRRTLTYAFHDLDSLLLSQFRLE